MNKGTLTVLKWSANPIESDTRRKPECPYPLHTRGFLVYCVAKLFTKLTPFVHQTHTDFYRNMWYNDSKIQSR